MIEDKILIWRFKGGRREALEQIYCKYEAMLVTVAASILADPSGAEDVVHDVFVTLAQSPDKVGLNGSLRHFLAACVANRAKDRLRARRHCTPVDDVEFLVPEGQQPEAIAAEQDELRRVWSGLAQLPEEQREAVVLHLTAGLRFRQIAETLGISINTAQSRYRYGMERLRSLVDGEANKP
jgi:RNA polymerase sigma-70 factor (ECF subfamily)